jgi:hypothetical protein
MADICIYQAKDRLKNNMCCFSDSVVIYNSYDGATYQFNAIVKWIIDRIEAQGLTTIQLQDELLDGVEDINEGQQLSDLLTKSLDQLSELKLISCQCQKP